MWPPSHHSHCNHHSHYRYHSHPYRHPCRQPCRQPFHQPCSLAPPTPRHRFPPPPCRLPLLRLERAPCPLQAPSHPPPLCLAANLPARLLPHRYATLLHHKPASHGPCHPQPVVAPPLIAPLPAVSIGAWQPATTTAPGSPRTNVEPVTAVQHAMSRTQSQRAAEAAAKEVLW